MEWRKISEERPPHGEMIWVWDNEKMCKFVITYYSDEEKWKMTKNSGKFPLWAFINKDADDGMD